MKRRVTEMVILGVLGLLLALAITPDDRTWNDVVAGGIGIVSAIVLVVAVVLLGRTLFRSKN